jgi:hypothetical protein
MVGCSIFQDRQRERLRFLDPGAVHTLKRLDRVGGVVLHALKQDDATTWRLDLGLNIELSRPDVQRVKLVFDEELR